MKPFIIALAAGLIAAALPLGTAGAADPQPALAAPAPTDPGTATPAPIPGVDTSRYRFYNGYWWYWTPDNHWLCYVNGQWVNPGTPVQAAVPAYPYPYVAPQPYYAPYPYGYGYPYPYYGGGIYIGGGYGGYWHGGGCGGYHR